MIDDATIKQVEMQVKLPTYNENCLFAVKMRKFARAIEQLARQEQREEDTRICEVFTAPTKAKGLDWLAETFLHKAGSAFAKAIRAAGKETE